MKQILSYSFFLQLRKAEKVIKHKTDREEKHLLDHAETQEFRDHSLAKRKQQVVWQSMLSAIFDYEKYDSYSASLYSEKIAGKETDQQLLLPTNQPLTMLLRVVFINKISGRHHYK